jgi:hypothetical protein
VRILRRIIVPAACIGAALSAGCADLRASPVAAQRTFELRIAVEEGAAPSPWVFEVPVPTGWKARTEEGWPIAVLVRRYSKGCELFVQVYAEPAPGSFPLAKVLKKADRVERGRRSVSAGGQQFAVTFRLGQIGGLAFGGGATGPGGFAALRFNPERADGAPKLVLTAQGGTEGSGCFSADLGRAPGLVVRGLRPIAARSTLRYADSSGAPPNPSSLPSGS